MSPPASSICQQAAILRCGPHPSPPRAGTVLAVANHFATDNRHFVCLSLRCASQCACRDPALPSALRVGEGEGGAEELGDQRQGGGGGSWGVRGDGHFSSFLLGSAIFHNLFCLVTPKHLRCIVASVLRSRFLAHSHSHTFGGCSD